MAIVVGGELPFRASAYTAMDDKLRIRVRSAPTVSSDDIRRIEAHGVIFVEGALMGMGAGLRVPPKLSDQSIDDALRVGYGTAGQSGVAFEAPVVIDPSYVTVLLHKLWALHEMVPIQEVVVELPGLSNSRSQLAIERGELSGLPAVHPALPFAFEDDMGGTRSDRQVLIGFAEPPSEDALEVLRHGMRVWLSQALQGGFIFAHVGPDDYFVAGDDTFNLVGDEIEWLLEKCRIDLRGLESMVNFLAAFHGQVAPLKFVVLE
ncbi:MAG: hypothetical protein AAF799_47810 [Myxococcota bacterium]